MTERNRPGSGRQRSLDENYFIKVLRTAFRRRSAQFGLAFIGLIAFCAVFAPLLANSHPLLLSDQGRLYSPMLRFLSAGDVALFSVFVIIVALIWLPIQVSQKLAVGAVSSATAVVLCFAFISPPQLTRNGT